MLRREHLLSLLLALASVTLCACKVRLPSPEMSAPDQASQVAGIRYAELIESLSQHRAVRSGLMTRMVYGRSQNGLPLVAFRLMDKKARPSSERPAVVMTEALHGNESLGVGPSLLEYFADHTLAHQAFGRFLAAGGIFYVVPVANPDGYEKTREAMAGGAAGAALKAKTMRGDALGRDLNRAFPLERGQYPGVRCPEVNEYMRYLDDEMRLERARLVLSIGYHCCGGMLLTPWGYVKPAPEAEIKLVPRYDDIGAIVSRVFGFQVGNSVELLDYAALGSSDDYATERFGATAMTLEGSLGPGNNGLDKHVAFWTEAFDTVLRWERSSPAPGER